MVGYCLCCESLIALAYTCAVLIGRDDCSGTQFAFILGQHLPTDNDLLCGGEVDQANYTHVRLAM